MTIKNNLYNIFGGGTRAALFLITIPLMVNILGVERFGIWSLITSIGNIALMLDAGIASTTMHYISEIKAINCDKNRMLKAGTSLPILFLINLFFSLTVFISFLFFTEQIAYIFLKKNLINDEIIVSLRWIGLYSSMILIKHFFSGILQAYNKFLLVNIIKFLNLFIINFGLLVLSFFNKNFTELTFFMFVTSFIVFIVYVVLASKMLNVFRLKFYFDLKKIKEIITYTSTTWIGYIGTISFAQFDKIIIGKIAPAEVLGIYAAIISVISYISSTATVGLQPIIPKLTELWSLFDYKKKEFLSEFKHAHQFNAVLIFVSSIGLLVIHRFIINNVMNIDLNVYPEVSLVFKIAVIIYALNALSVPGFYSLMAIKKTKYLSLWQTLGTALALFSIYILGINYGLLGVVLGNLGLIITWSFNFISSKITLSNRNIWIKFIYLPLFIFLSVGFCFIIFENKYVNSALSILSIYILLRWYLKNNTETYNMIKKLLRHK